MRRVGQQIHASVQLGEQYYQRALAVAYGALPVQRVIGLRGVSWCREKLEYNVEISSSELAGPFEYVFEVNVYSP